MENSIAKELWCEYKKSMSFRECAKTYFEPFVLIYLWITDRVDISAGTINKRK